VLQIGRVHISPSNSGPVIQTGVPAAVLALTQKGSSEQQISALVGAGVPRHDSPAVQHESPQICVAGQPPWHTPSTHCSPSAQRFPQRPQWRSFLCRLTHLSLQRVRPVGQAQTLSSPRLTQFPEQHWESLLHSRPKLLQSSLAKATPGKEAKHSSQEGTSH
jgi:hypothetical protein